MDDQWFVFPDPEPPVINILYGWSEICVQFDLCFLMFSFETSSKLIIVCIVWLYCYVWFFLLLNIKSLLFPYAYVPTESIDCIILSSFELKAILLIFLVNRLGLYVLIMSRTRFRVNPQSIVARCDIWSLSDCNRTRTHNHLVCKRKLNHLAKLTKRLSFIVSTYRYGAFDCIFLSCHLRVSEWIYIL